MYWVMKGFEALSGSAGLGPKAIYSSRQGLKIQEVLKHLFLSQLGFLFSNSLSRSIGEDPHN